jgi:hypothetical protein
MPKPNKPVPGPVAHPSDPVNLALIEIDKDIAKLQKRRAELVQQLGFIEEYNQDQAKIAREIRSKGNKEND